MTKGPTRKEAIFSIRDERLQTMIKQALAEGLRMSDVERLTVTMPADLAAAVRRAVETGDYASTSEVIRAALSEWKVKRALEIEELAALRADIAMGLADIAAGRVNEFSANEIIARGRKILAESSPSD